jgi:hypothetical protein
MNVAGMKGRRVKERDFLRQKNGRLKRLVWRSQMREVRRMQTANVSEYVASSFMMQVIWSLST